MEEFSFSTQVKDELAHLFPTQKCCQRSELAALLRACGRIQIGSGGRLSCIMATDHAPVARKILRLIRSGFGLQPVTMVMRQRRLRKKLTYLIRLPAQPGFEAMLRETGVLDAEGRLTGWGDLAALKQEHCHRAYLRGSFLGTGWVSAPERQHHLELTTTATEAADALGQMLFDYGMPVRMQVRKGTVVLYLKDGDHVVRFLSVVGAHQALLRYEDVRAMKEMKNRVNRQVNAETANLQKTVVASARQVELLEQLRAAGGLGRLPPSLRELAQLRLSHPDASLKELGEMCNPQVSKSAINHRMRQLMQLAGTHEHQA